MDEILQKIEKMEKLQDAKHSEIKRALATQNTLFFQKIEDLSNKIDPVVKIYTDISGTGRIMRWLFIILTSVGGAIITFKAVFSHKII